MADSKHVYAAGEVERKQVYSLLMQRQYPADMWTGEVDRVHVPKRGRAAQATHYAAIEVHADTEEKARDLATRVAALLNEHGDGWPE